MDPFITFLVGIGIFNLIGLSIALKEELHETNAQYMMRRTIAERTA